MCERNVSAAAGAIAAPMLAASFTPRSTTRPMMPCVMQAAPGFGAVSSERIVQAAPVTVRCEVGIACVPISSGMRYCRSAVQKWLAAAQATLLAKPPSMSIAPMSKDSDIVEQAL